MRIHIRHETFYAYETPLSYSVQRLYLTPQNFAAPEDCRLENNSARN